MKLTQAAVTIALLSAACASAMASPDTATDPAPVQSDEPVQAETAPDPTKAVVKKVQDSLGLEFWGYARGGFYGAPNGLPKGQYQLGGDLQHFRLGNEGDNYVEFGIGKKFDLGDGLKWGIYYMPKVYNGDTGTAQLYTTISGLDFAPSVTWWVGQRYHRIQDVHILDNWIVEDGDNYGAGADYIPVGLGRLNVSISSSGSFDNHDATPNNAKRVNLQWHDIPTGPGGTLTLTAAKISGDFLQGSDGGALGLLHKQKDIFVPGLNNAFFLQASSGHSSINGKFYNLDNSVSTLGIVAPGSLDSLSGGLFTPLVTSTVLASQPGARQRRIIESIDFQIGRWGGQALVGYQTKTPDNSIEIKDLSVGGRVSYGLAKHIKLLGELGVTRRSIDGQSTQTLNKGTLALALSPNANFWTRPEIRLYATRASWNNAAAVANAATFGANGRSSATTFGVQMEAWWE